jgi:superfamily II DNA helicase RecQ
VGNAAKKKEVEEIVLRMVRQKLRKHKTGKVVVYANLVPKVNALAVQLGCGAYHHKTVGKASMLQAFATGNQRMIVATSALGMGVDIPDIRCVVHVDWPFTVLDYAQESGRAGRDGLRSEAVMIVQEGEQRPAKDKQAEAEQQLVRAYVGIEETATCRRVVLDGYLDSRATERVVCEEGEEKCDVCRRANGAEDDEGASESGESSESSESSEDGSRNEEVLYTVEPERDEAQRDEARRVFEQQQQARRGPRRTLIQQRQQAFADMEWLRTQLARRTMRCGICEAVGEGESGHDVRQC